MATDAAAIDSSALPRPMLREPVKPERDSPVINGGHNGGPVEIKGEMSFWDFLDIINPLQHIPLVNTVYRQITGDSIQSSMQVMGDILYGGVVGGMASIANAVIEESTGKNVGDTVMASLGFGGGDHPAAAEAVADASGGPAASGSPAEPRTEAQETQAASAGGLAAALAAARPPAGAATGAAAAGGLPIRLGTDPAAAGSAASPTLVAQLAAGGAVPHPSKMPPRDTPLASSALAKHSIARNAAPTTGSVLAGARPALPASAAMPAAEARDTAAPTGAAPTMQAGPAPVPPDMLSETMMRNLAKYEQSRKAVSTAAQSAGTTRVSG